MANADSVGQNTGDSFSNYRLGVIRATSLNTAGNAVITIPILSGGLTNSGNAATSGEVIVRRITVQNPTGSVALANVSVGLTGDGANLITAVTSLSSVNAVGKFQDIAVTSTYQTTAITGNVTQCFYVNVGNASTTSSTVDICVWGDVVAF